MYDSSVSSRLHQHLVWSVFLILVILICVYIFVILICNSVMANVGFPGGSVVKNPPDNARASGLVPGLRRPPGEESGNPLQYSCLGNPRDRKSLMGYSPWGPKESGMTERLSAVFLQHVLVCHPKTVKFHEGQAATCFVNDWHLALAPCMARGTIKYLLGGRKGRMDGELEGGTGGVRI